MTILQGARLVFAAGILIVKGLLILDTLIYHHKKHKKKRKKDNAEGTKPNNRT